MRTGPVKLVFDVLHAGSFVVDVPAALVETNKHPCMADAIKATLKNVGIELIEYRSCTIHPPVDERRLYRMTLA